MVYYALLATLGSVAGCFVLYLVGPQRRRGVSARALHERHVERALAASSSKYGLLVVIVPSLLPPPAPFKIFVLPPASPRAGLSISASRSASARGVRLLRRGAARRSGTASSAARIPAVTTRAHGVARPSPRRVLVAGVGLDLVSSADAAARIALTRSRKPRIINRLSHQKMVPEISVVIPMRNESPNVAELYRELTAALEALRAPVRDHRRSTTAAPDDTFDAAGGAAGGGPAAARDPVPAQLRPDRGVRRRLRARPRPLHRDLRRRPAERSARHSGDGRAARAAASTSSAAGARTGRTRSSTAGCRR